MVIIFMAQFSLWQPLIGGALIGLAAALLLLLNGRIAGVSGIVGGLLQRRTGDWPWRGLFVVGLILGGLLYQLAGGEVEHITALVDQPLLIVAGLLVGAGATLGSGCTSGHGVCGIARLSTRSLLATITFMATGVMTATAIGVLS